MAPNFGAALRSAAVLCGLSGISGSFGCGNTDVNPSMGSGGSAGSANPGNDDERLLPWATGNSWTYRVTMPGAATQTKTTTVVAEEKVGGMGPNADLTAFHVTTNKGQSDHTESWQGPDAEEPLRIVRYREQSFGAMTGALQVEEHWAPSRLHVDGSAAHTTKGASWQEAYSETQLVVNMPLTTRDLSDNWQVVDDDESISVPAGDFAHVIHLRKTGPNANNKDYWYARGVGKLKETGAQTEELADYGVAPP